MGAHQPRRLTFFNRLERYLFAKHAIASHTKKVLRLSRLNILVCNSVTVLDFFLGQALLESRLHERIQCVDRSLRIIARFRQTVEEVDNNIDAFLLAQRDRHLVDDWSQLLHIYVVRHL